MSMKTSGIVLAVLLSLIANQAAHSVAIHASADPVKDEPKITEKDKEHWAFRPLEVVAGKTGIDDFSKPGPEADAATLLRRVTFDLTGLPPTQEEVKAFVEDKSVSYEAVVDRLLESPRHGEHWAQWWLDLARYAETDGFEYDAERGRAWQYRDWVIGALNKDLPFDVFVQRQIAGDLLPESDEVATGFLFSCPDMPDLNDQDERRHGLLNDITGTIGSVGLGLTVGCAQCHDHPYDPVSQADFYRLRAFFDNTVLTKNGKQLGPAVRVFTAGVPASTVFVRGDFKRPGPVITPAFPRLFGETPPKADRVALAQWLTGKDNALFLRAMANRLWQQHFGRPLAAVPGDLGHQGEAPTNPALLDWLAAELPRQAWSLKKMHKLMMMSQTYRQSGQARKRLTGEMLRDAMLSVTSTINLKAGGPSARLPFPKEIASTLLKKQTEATTDVTEHQRRSIYTFARRNARNPLFDLFDRPDALMTCSRRNESTTAPQALMLMNSEFAQDMAGRLAAVLTEAHGSETQAIIKEATVRCLARIPTEAEIVMGEKFLHQQSILTPNFREALADYCLALLNSNEFIYID